jgi:hypothetical protein
VCWGRDHEGLDLVKNVYSLLYGRDMRACWRRNAVSMSGRLRQRVESPKIEVAWSEENARVL